MALKESVALLFPPLLILPYTHFVATLATIEDFQVLRIPLCR